MTLRLVLLLALGATATLAQAETYKWVDENGVTNYSNTPPPAGKAKITVQAVQDRLSVIPSEPAGASLAAPAVYQRLQALEAEWLQRQRLMATAAAYAPPPPTMYDEPRYATPYVPVVAVRRPLFMRSIPLRTRARISLEPSRTGSPR
jgi:Domain of unknown function (DUF4124)